MPSITADFSATPLTGKAPLRVQFTDLSVAEDTEITGWDWDFGDEGTGSTQNPFHIYTEAGLYTVELEVDDGSISDNKTIVGLIYILEPDNLPQLSIAVPATSAAIVDLDLYWQAYGLADENTEYMILSDAAASGDFQVVATVPATDRDPDLGEYQPYLYVLGEAIDPTDRRIILDLAPASPFGDGTRIRIEGETIILGGTDFGQEIFPASKRGQDNTIRRAHAVGAVVAGMHEHYQDEGVDFTGRHVIRYHIVTITSDGAQLPVEALAIKPTRAPTNDYCVIWGVAQDSLDQPIVGLAVRLAIVGNDVYNVRTGEVFSTDEAQDVQSDADGYWEVLAPRDVAISRLNAVRLTIGDRDIVLSGVPDVGAINYLECI